MRCRDRDNLSDKDTMPLTGSYPDETPFPPIVVLVKAANPSILTFHILCVRPLIIVTVSITLPITI